MRGTVRRLCLVISFVPAMARAAEVAEYQAVRAARPDGRTVSVNEFTLTRDVYRFTFHSGTFHLIAPLGERTFGAVFLGNGEYVLDPATAAERRQLALTSGDKELKVLTDTFDRLVLLFSDRTATELQNGGPAREGPPDARAREIYEEYLAQQKKKYQLNLHLRVLQDILNGVDPKNGVFLAPIAGKKYGRALIAIDPLGIGNLAAKYGYFGGEEIAFISFDEENGGFWYLSAPRAEAISGRGKPLPLLVDGLHYRIDTKIPSNLEIEGTTTIRFQPLVEGLRVLPIHILPKLRLKEASYTSGDRVVPVAFIQEEIELGRIARLFQDEVADADAALVFGSPLQKGETTEVTIRYGGRDVLYRIGPDQYSVRARESWYPNVGTFTDPATYQLTYHFPHRVNLVSVGELVREEQEGRERVSVWKSDRPMRIAGFNYGRFEKRTEVDEPSSMQIDVFTHPDRRKMAADTMADARNTARVASAFFGKPPFSSVSVTQQSEWNFGQSWPSLVYLPTLALTTSTERVMMFEGIGPDLWRLHEFAKMVGWHEFAHQWWGHLVGWESYRDQWLSEGFAEFTAALVLQFTESYRKYADYWARRREDILAKRGVIANADAGAISQGFRLATKRTPGAAQAGIYLKGGYVLHMLRMLMRDPTRKNPDETFIDMMHDFVSSYSGRNPSTADFQKVVERHMTPLLNAAEDRKMDYFFNQWVHGTEIPRFRSTLTVQDAGNGKYRISGSVSQEGVSNDFRVVVPIYLDYGKDELARLGAVRLIGTAPQKVEAEIPLPRAPKRVVLNALNDVLARQ